MPGAGRPRYFREISIVDFFPRFVHAKDDGTIASRSKSRREKLVDDRSRVQSNQQLFKYAIQRQIRDHVLKPSRAFVEAVAQAGWLVPSRFEYWIRLLYDEPSLTRLVSRLSNVGGTYLVASVSPEQQPTLFSQRKQRLAVRFVPERSWGREW